MSTDRTVRPLSLRQTAAAVARNHGDKGAVVISYGEEGIRIGTESLTPAEVREALCVAMHYSFLFEDEQRPARYHSQSETKTPGAKDAGRCRSLKVLPYEARIMRPCSRHR